MDIIVEVEGEPGNYIRVSFQLAEEMGVVNGDKVLRKLLI